MESDALVWTAPPLALDGLRMSGGAFVVWCENTKKTEAIAHTLQKRRRACESHRMSKRRRSPNEGVAFHALVGLGSPYLLASNYNFLAIPAFYFPPPTSCAMIAIAF